ncbi:hypothetical protein QO206_13310 [Leeuwenhoekiella aequorea]|uniref:hypothetical protein n=1 Tax=Leeuwenhoekiella aequorea TaxID=283736 RepID=UPI00352FCED7|tara:strand:+ start:21927 stop:22202 length:276 start_codon:yes stop_codon:yes gene_type:complete
MKKFRKKLVVTEAIQYEWNNRDKVLEFINGKTKNGDINFETAWASEDKIVIKTLEGDITASINDFIIKGGHGEFFSCKPDIFFKTYELVLD